MRRLSHRIYPRTVVLIAVICAILAIFSIIFTHRAFAADQQAATPEGAKLLTVFDRGKERGIMTAGTTIGEALEQAGIIVGQNDLVEPALDEKLVARSYSVNIYRARPVTIIDGAVSQRILTPYQTSRQIVEDAGMTLQDEDKTTVEPVTDMTTSGAGLQVVIDRATPFTLVLYGKTTQAYTQAATVEDMLREKGITLASNDSLSVNRQTAITAGMTVELWRNGKQTVTVEEEVAFPIEKVQDADRPVGFHEVKTPGEKGKRTVSYEVVMRNGVEESRKEIQSVTTKEPKKQVEIVGAKPKVPTNPSENAQLGHEMMLAYGFGEDQWSCLYNLWMKESGWRVNAANPSSDAYGIPQALPGSKMGPGWQDDARVQIQWGLGYVKGRYGTPCGAWSSFLAKGWY